MVPGPEIGWQLVVPPRYAICVRRNLSHASLSSFGAIVLSDIGRGTVARAEADGAQALQQYVMWWHRSREREMNRTLLDTGYGQHTVIIDGADDVDEADAVDGASGAAVPPAPAPVAALAAVVAVPIDRFQISFHMFAGDATNSKVYQGSKVHSLALTSAYMLDHTVVPGTDMLVNMDVERFLGDIQVCALKLLCV